VHYKSRFNSSLKRDDVIHEVSSLFLNFGHKVDLKNPDIVVVVEIMRVRDTCNIFSLTFMGSVFDMVFSY
jgi:tRNA(Ser,Leu) C12 N-acetylase TAN1